LQPGVISVLVQSRPSGVVGGKKFAGGKSALYERVDGIAVVHPLGAAPPKLMESDGRAGSILDFRQVRHA
jgi:hypothetical protein